MSLRVSLAIFPDLELVERGSAIARPSMKSSEEQACERTGDELRAFIFLDLLGDLDILSMLSTVVNGDSDLASTRSDH